MLELLGLRPQGRCGGYEGTKGAKPQQETHDSRTINVLDVRDIRIMVWQCDIRYKPNACGGRYPTGRELQPQVR